MKTTDLEKMFDPPANGRDKLGRRLDSQIRAERLEKAALKFASCALVLAMLSFAEGSRRAVEPADFGEAASLLSSAKPNPARGNQPVNIDSIEVPVKDPRIRMYWIFR